MPVEVAMWRVENGEPVRISSQGAPLESGLESLIEKDPAILGETLLIVGRQVHTDYGSITDLLAIDMEGNLHLLELKRERTPREVVAQALDYGSWIKNLGHEDVLDIFSKSYPGIAFEIAFADRFGCPPPEELNTAHSLTIIANEVDAATERIVTYLRNEYSVPINVAFFNYFADDGREYLARTWLIDEKVAPKTSSRPRAGSQEQWDGRYWYSSFGEDSGSRSWDDARRYGFISAGGAVWYGRTIRSLPEGSTVFVYIPKTGYVGYGATLGMATRFDETVVIADGVETKLAELPLVGHYTHENDDDDDNAEWFVPIRWEATLGREEAIREKGMFANQNSACRLKNKFTINILEERFGVTQDIDDQT